MQINEAVSRFYNSDTLATLSATVTRLETQVHAVNCDIEDIQQRLGTLVEAIASNVADDALVAMTMEVYHLREALQRKEARARQLQRELSDSADERARHRTIAAWARR